MPCKHMTQRRVQLLERIALHSLPPDIPAELQRSATTEQHNTSTSRELAEAPARFTTAMVKNGQFFFLLWPALFGRRRFHTNVAKAMFINR